MDILEKYVSSEITVKNSRFLGELFPCAGQSDARTVIKNQKVKYTDATHVVHAFVIGHGAEIMGMSDDGEPPGTAGRPVLDVVKGKRCTNLVLTVTRWFGGTLLGTGGLVKAYGDCAKAVFEAAAAESAISAYVEKRRFSFSAGYSEYQTLKHILSQFTLYDFEEQFGTDVTVSASAAAAEFPLLESRIKDASNGKIRIICSRADVPAADDIRSADLLSGL